MTAPPCAMGLPRDQRRASPRRGRMEPESRIVTIPNAVRFVAPERVALREELRLRPDDRLLVSVGNLYHVKGHAYLIDALARLIAPYPTLHVAISGRGELAGMLAARAQALGLADRVHLLGLRSDVASILAAASLVSGNVYDHTSMAPCAIGPSRAG